MADLRRRTRRPATWRPAGVAAAVVIATQVADRDVIAFRLGAHNLSERLGADGLLEAAGRCGIQNSPPGSALLALHARVAGVTQAVLDVAAAEEKSLLQTWCMRGAPFYFPVADAPVFTAGVLPPTEEGMRHLILGVEQSLDRLGMGLSEAVERCGAEVVGVLSGRRLAINELGAEVAGRIAPRLPKEQRAVWEAPGPHAPGQPVGEAVVHFCLRILTLQRVVCFAPREGNKAPFVLVDEWLDSPVPDVEPAAARAELLRRYLGCYGPSTPAHFAAWLGIKPGDSDPWWSLVEDELTEVEFGGRAWILSHDLEALRSATAPKGVRLLPPRDPYTQMRDRDTIVDKRRQREVWKTLGDPGAVLADGRIVGVWRPRKNGRRLTVTVTTFAPAPARTQRALATEAEAVARLRGAASVDVQYS